MLFLTTNTRFTELVEIVKMLHKIERTVLDARFSMLETEFSYTRPEFEYMMWDMGNEM